MINESQKFLNFLKKKAKGCLILICSYIITLSTNAHKLQLFD